MFGDKQNRSHSFSTPYGVVMCIRAARTSGLPVLDI